MELKIQKLAAELVRYLESKKIEGLDSLYLINIDETSVTLVDIIMNEIKIARKPKTKLDKYCGDLISLATQAYGVLAIKKVFILVCDEVACEVGLSKDNLRLEIYNLDSSLE